MHEFQEKLIFLQKEDILGENMELFALILIKIKSLGQFGLAERTLGSEFGRTELTFDMCRTERSVHHYFFSLKLLNFLKNKKSNALNLIFLSSFPGDKVHLKKTNLTL